MVVRGADRPQALRASKQKHVYIWMFESSSDHICWSRPLAIERASERAAMAFMRQQTTFGIGTNMATDTSAQDTSIADSVKTEKTENPKSQEWPCAGVPMVRIFRQTEVSDIWHVRGESLCRRPVLKRRRKRIRDCGHEIPRTLVYRTSSYLSGRTSRASTITAASVQRCTENLASQLDPGETYDSGCARSEWDASRVRGLTSVAPKLYVTEALVCAPECVQHATGIGDATLVYSPALAHDCISPQNMLIDPKTLQITARIDWELVSIAPGYFEDVSACHDSG
nr:hypothetical protein CFP56_11697 [Quercus suber]